MAVSDFVSGGSTIIAEKHVDALYRSIVLLSELESKANRDNPGQQTNYVSYQITGDASKTFTSTLSLPARMVRDTATNNISLFARNFIVDYLTWIPGTGDLVNAVSLPEAIVHLCNLITYLERQIDPNIVIQTPNQVNITPNQEAGTFDISITLPCEVNSDPTTGQIDFTMFNYLFVLDAV
ncbi:MAG: hypothetical protein RLZZ135_2460 [Cyanobacteriota bacterium]|jgi:hypothetical protein